MIAYPTRGLLDAVDAETPQTGAVWLIERAASFYEGAGIAMREILGSGVLAREAEDLERDLRYFAGRAWALEILASEALARVEP